MKEQLIRYVDLLFAAAADADDIKQEILQNTLDRYDDLIAQGKTPQAAYQLAISGIGDINEILSSKCAVVPASPVLKPAKEQKPLWKVIMQAIAILLYIICPIPVIVLGDIANFESVAVCGTLGIVAVATALIIIAGGKNEKKEKAQDTEAPQKPLQKAILSAVQTVGLCLYFILSFSTGAWYITWVIFPLLAAINGLVNACFDLKEGS